MAEQSSGVKPGTVLAGANMGGASKDSPAESNVLGSQNVGGHGSHIPIKLNGESKTISVPTTGAALHRLAGGIDGYPVALKSGLRAIPNTAEIVDVKPDQEFTTK